MYWTLELASKLEDAPWPATKEELLDYATRSGVPMEVIENLEEIEFCLDFFKKQLKLCRLSAKIELDRCEDIDSNKRRKRT